MSAPAATGRVVPCVQTRIPDREAVGLEEQRRCVWRYLRFVGCPRDAVDDLVQEVLLAGCRAWPDGGMPTPWLLATARNQLRKLWRARGRSRELVDVDRLDRMWREHVEQDGEPTLRALRACLGALPARSRQVLELRYRDGLGRDAIAARLGLAAEGVKSLLVRVREALRRCIQRRSDAQ